jgi:hypothetical protein
VTQGYTCSRVFLCDVLKSDHAFLLQRLRDVELAAVALA